MSLLALLIVPCGVLFRIPRGGPDGFPLGSTAASVPWAVALGGSSYLWGLPWYCALGVAVWMFLAEKPGWMRWVSDTRVDVIPLALRGLPMLNPLFGVPYALLRGRKVPLFGKWMDGWTAWAELTNGLLTSTALYALVLTFY